MTNDGSSADSAGQSDHESNVAGTTPDEKSGSLPSRWRLAAPAIVFALVFAALLLSLYSTGVLDKIYDKDALRAWVEARGALAPLAYVGFLMLRPFTFVPSSLFAPVAFALFGVVDGALLKVCGETCGSSLAFLASRFGFRRAVSHAFGATRRGEDSDGRDGFGSRLGELLEQRGLRTVLALRFNLLIPFDAINYGLGLTRVPLAAFFFGTLIGILPGTFLYVALAGSALEGQGWNLAFVLAALSVMVWLSIPLARDLLRRAPPRQA